MNSNATSLEARPHFLSQFGTSRLDTPHHQRLQLSSPPLNFSIFEDIFRSQAVMSDSSHSIAHRLAVPSLQDLIQPSTSQADYSQVLAASSVLPFTMTNALSLDGLPGFAAASDALLFPGSVQSLGATNIFGLPNLPQILQHCFAQPSSVPSTLDQFLLQVCHSQDYQTDKEERQQKRPVIAAALSSLRTSEESACDAAALLLAVKIMQRDGSSVSSQTVCQEENAILLAISDDELRLNEQQIFIRNQIEVFRATASEVLAHTRGRYVATIGTTACFDCKIHCVIHAAVDFELQKQACGTRSGRDSMQALCPLITSPSSKGFDLLSIRSQGSVPSRSEYECGALTKWNLQ